jgi:hypothetical protein
MNTGSGQRKLSIAHIGIGLVMLVIALCGGGVVMMFGGLAVFTCASGFESVPLEWQGTWSTATGRRVVVHRSLVSTVEGTNCRDLAASKRDERLDVCVGTFIIDESKRNAGTSGVFEIQSFHTYAPGRRVNCTRGYIKGVPDGGLEVVFGQHDDDPMCALSLRLTKLVESRADERKRKLKAGDKTHRELSKEERAKIEAVQRAKGDMPHNKWKAKNAKVRRAQERIRRTRRQRPGGSPAPEPVPAPGGNR